VLRVIIGYAQTNLFLNLKASTWCEQHEGRWLERIVGGQLDPAVVDSTLKLTVSRAQDSKLPLEDVLLLKCNYVTADL